MTKMLVTFECETADFGVLMGAIGETMDRVHNLKATPIAEPVKRTRTSAPKSTSRPGVGGTLYKNSKVMQIILKMIEEGRSAGVRMSAIQDELELHDFSRNSASPALSLLTKAGTIIRLDANHYIGKQFVAEAA